MDEAVEAEKIAWETIVKVQPGSELPAWIVQNATSNKTKLSNARWKVEFYLFKKLRLLPDESWEKTADGSKVLVRVDPNTGKKAYAIHLRHDDTDRVPLFEIEIDLTSKEVIIKNAVDLTSLNPDEYELFAC